MLPEAGLSVLHHLAGAGGGCIEAGLLGEGGHRVLGLVSPGRIVRTRTVCPCVAGL